MKATGIVRSIDNMGRLVLPIELRKMMKLGEKDAVEIFTEGNTIVLQKYAPSCTFCQNTENLTSFKGQNVCAKCIAKLAILADGEDD